MDNLGSAVDGVSLSPPMLTVRGTDLNTLVGTSTYASAIFHVIVGKEPTHDQEAALDRFLTECLAQLPADDPMLQVTALVARAGTSLPAAMAAGFLAGGYADEADAPTLRNLGVPVECGAGLRYLALAPRLLAQAAASGHDGAGDELVDVRARTGDYLGSMFRLVAGFALAGHHRDVFEATMVSFHAGFGFLTPTVLLPRAAISTGVPVAHAIAAGYTGAGPYHVGACAHAMRLFDDLAINRRGDDCRGAVRELLRAGAVIPGFGHPLFEQDPRNSHLRAFVARSGLESPYLGVYDAVVEVMREEVGIYPNIDSISAAIFLTLGIDSRYGTGLFLCSRTAAMVAHIVEKRQQPAFGARSKDVRKWLGDLPKAGAEIALAQ